MGLGNELWGKWNLQKKPSVNWNDGVFCICVSLETVDYFNTWELEEIILNYTKKKKNTHISPNFNVIDENDEKLLQNWSTQLK